jgi:hypothetical protein
MRETDPEAWYHLGSLMAYCGQKDAAVRLLRGAIQQNFCAYEALQTDPLLLKLRGTPELSELVSVAKRCQHVQVQKRSLSARRISLGPVRKSQDASQAAARIVREATEQK